VSVDVCYISYGISPSLQIYVGKGILLTDLVGKTPLRLIEDLRDYDPSVPFNGPPSKTILVGSPPKFIYGEKYILNKQPGACRHSFFLKDRQILLPLEGSRPGPTCEYKVAVFCDHCLCHFNIEITWEDKAADFQPCPSPDHPLHFFQYAPKKSKTRPNHLSKDELRHTPWEDVKVFDCISQTCKASLRIEIRPPRLTPSDVDYLTNQAKIGLRAGAAQREDPARLGVPAPTPAKVLKTLLSYVENALLGTDKRPIAQHNKHFATALGPSSKELLRRLGFQDKVL
jgi:ubiquitin carboxyl-terminal hydrolase 25